MAEPAGTRVVFCGDRAVAVRLVAHVQANGGEVVALGVNAAPLATHADALLRSSEVADEAVFCGRELCTPAAADRLAASKPDLGVCCGFAHRLPAEVLAAPAWGWVNLHRGYLPYNRGVCTLQWALMDATPAGVSLHVMTEALDAGPVIARRRIPVLPTDDGHSLGLRADEAAFALFAECWPRLSAGSVEGVCQDHAQATAHTLADCVAARRLDLDASLPVRALLDRLRAYTGPGIPPAYFEQDGTRYAVRVHIEELSS